MPLLKFAAMMVLVLLLGLAATSAEPDGQVLTEAPSTRLNLDYLAPEAQAFFGPDMYLAAPPIWNVDPIEDPRGACYKTCQNEFVSARRACELIASDPDIDVYIRQLLYSSCIGKAMQDKEMCINRRRCAEI